MPKKKPKKKPLDWAADDVFDKNRSIIFIEHTYECPIFQKKAEEFKQFLIAEIPERMFELVRNKNGKLVPRPGAFEIGFSQNARTSVHDLWSGLDKGPPRRDKFPDDYATLLPTVRAVLKKFYAEPTKHEDDEVMDDDGGYNM